MIRFAAAIARFTLAGALAGATAVPSTSFALAPGVVAVLSRFGLLLLSDAATVGGRCVGG